MTDVYINSGDQPLTPSDAELILEVRGGDLRAFGELYGRHAAAAWRLAMSYVRNTADADDVVADAFDRVLRVLQAGQGPDQVFRAYLFSVVRNAAIELTRKHQRTHPASDPATFEAALSRSSATEDPAVAGFERSVVARAYKSLPERWQAVLWYLEVEGCTPAEVAPILGLTPNGVSALAYRAREGLRTGYLQQHLAGEPADGCRSVNAHLGGYVRGSLAHREVAKIEAHLKSCGSCRTLVLELSDVAHGMRGIVAPLVLGTAGLSLLGALPLGAAAGGTMAAGAGGTMAAGGTAMGGSAVGGAAAGGSVASGAVTGTAGTAAVSTAAAGTAAAGTAAEGAAAVGTATVGPAAAGTAAAGTTALGTTAVGTTAVGTTAAGTTAATASTVAAGVVVSGTSAAVAAGAVAVAAVGVVTVIQAMVPDTSRLGPQASPVVSSQPALPVDDYPLPVDDGPPLAGATLPAATPADTSVLDGAPLIPLLDPAELSVAPVSTGELEPRVAQRLAVKVTNAGEQAALGTTARFQLERGLEPARGGAVFGAGVPSSGLPLTVEAARCGADPADPSAVLCDLGDLSGGETVTVAFDVVARLGGSYDIGGEIWADGVNRTAVEIPPADVHTFGAELTARVGRIEDLPNPGSAELRVAVANTGDQTAAAGWSVGVLLPEGLTYAGVTGGLDCVADPDRPRALRCAAPAATTLAPRERVRGSLLVAAPASEVAGALTVAAVPVGAAGSAGHVVSGSGTVLVRKPWDGVADVPLGVDSACSAFGGVSTADSTVVGSLRNSTGLGLSARLDAAGSSSSWLDLAPGEQGVLTVHDGIRVPAGTGEWVLRTVVAGTTYERRVPAGGFGAADCYDPAWDVVTSVAAVNAHGQVRLVGSITNTTGEPMRATMEASGHTAEAVHVEAGTTATAAVDLGVATLDAGVASFRLFRWVADVDGDQPLAEVVPRVAPTAEYGAVAIAPRVGTPSGERFAGACRYDPASETSTRVVRVPLDNSRSTLPVTFTVGGTPRTVAAGEKTVVEVPATFGQESVAVLADGRPLDAVPAGFESCASLDWPTDVTASLVPRCTEPGALASRPQVAVTVASAGRDYAVRTTLGRGTWTGAVTVAPGSPVTEALTLGRGLHARAGEVVVQLTRVIEGRTLTATRAMPYAAVTCVVVAPQARLTLGEAPPPAEPLAESSAESSVAPPAGRAAGHQTRVPPASDLWRSAGLCEQRL